MGQCVLHQSERENMSYMSMDCLSPPKSPEAGVSSRTTDSLMASLTMAPRKPFGHVRLTNFLHELSEWTKGEFMMSSNRVFGYKFHKSTRVVILYTTDNAGEFQPGEDACVVFPEKVIKMVIILQICLEGSEQRRRRAFVHFRVGRGSPECPVPRGRWPR